MLKLRKELCNVEKNSYASHEVLIPEGGIDCSEGCNPYRYPKEVLTAINNFDVSKYSMYPHETKEYDAIIEFWDEAIKINRDNILLANGSADGLHVVNDAFALPNSKILSIEPQFTDYINDAVLMGMEYVPVPLLKEEGYKFIVERMLDKITNEYSLLYIDNPNNPTGQTISIEDIKKVLDKAKECDVCVIIDEAYGDFIPKTASAATLINDYDNLVVTRTMSKGFGLASIRAGYILANENLITPLSKLSNPYVLNELARVVMHAAITAKSTLGEHIAAFNRCKKALKAVVGDNLTMAETDDNVPICMLHYYDNNVDLKDLFIKHGVLTVSCETFFALDKSYVRVRMPKEEDIDVLIKAAKAINEM